MYGYVPELIKIVYFSQDFFYQSYRSDYKIVSWVQILFVVAIVAVPDPVPFYFWIRDG